MNSVVNNKNEKIINLLKKYSEDYLLIDFNYLFISTCIKDEAILLGGEKADQVTEIVMKYLDKYDFDIDITRDLSTYSGGERVIIACVLLIVLAEVAELDILRILFVNIFESLSKNNKGLLLELLEKEKNIINISLYTKNKNNISLVL